jgi:hypothetical protein
MEFFLVSNCRLCCDSAATSEPIRSRQTVKLGNEFTPKLKKKKGEFFHVINWQWPSDLKDQREEEE